jgi:hypothetical protein
MPYNRQTAYDKVYYIYNKVIRNGVKLTDVKKDSSFAYNEVEFDIIDTFD